MGYLHQVASIPTSGARAVEPCEVAGVRYLVIPQLALDIPGAQAGLDGGNSDAAGVLVVRTDDFAVVQTLPVPGGEDAEFFTSGGRGYLAVANVRSGSGPYVLDQPQRIYEWTAAGLYPVLTIDGYAAKQWRYFGIGGREFLALAQGVTVGEAEGRRPSTIYEWTGELLEPLQEVPSAWGYNWHPFTIGETHYLAYADHIAPSVLLRWNGFRFEVVQVLIESHGRAFADFSVGGEHYLLTARLVGDCVLLRWDGARFVEHQRLDGPGGREFAVLRRDADLFVIRVNFITGTPGMPVAALNSQIYRWQSGRLVVVEEFPTTGATDVATWQQGPDTFVAVSNGLSADIRFTARTAIYRFEQEAE